ncbi:hypothetical protein Pmani_022132 [Petrolisthes manimaculis]|uniref:Uncharacterized protein n=1 Tax=Petrolisthes manimaculis TaxID=1843537 RepID=A0AAE1U4Q3_9EUCA|nr:hypothetical protein Pmani_022132 [Petrolisthes manimaculis]
MGLPCIDGLANSGLLGHILALKEQKNRSGGRGVARRRLHFSNNTPSSSSSSSSENNYNNNNSQLQLQQRQKNLKFASQQLEADAKDDAKRWNFNFTSMRPKPDEGKVEVEGERERRGLNWKPVIEDEHNTAPLYYAPSSYPILAVEDVISSDTLTNTIAYTPDTLSNTDTYTPDTLATTTYTPDNTTYTPDTLSNTTYISSITTMPTDTAADTTAATKCKRHQVKRLRQTICTDYFKKTRSAKPHLYKTTTGGVAEGAGVVTEGTLCFPSLPKSTDGVAEGRL